MYVYHEVKIGIICTECALDNESYTYHESLLVLSTSYCFGTLYPNQNHPWCKKSCGQELKKGLDKKEMKSKWVAKACVVLLLIKIKF